MSVADRTQILPRLWQGSLPETGDAVARAGFHVLVLASEQHQLAADLFPGVQVLHCPLFDGLEPPTAGELAIAETCAYRMAEHHAHGASLLTTCAMGWNRSGLLNAMAGRLITRGTGLAMRRHVQAARPNALNNAHFRAYLDALGEPSGPSLRRPVPPLSSEEGALLRALRLPRKETP